MDKIEKIDSIISMLSSQNLSSLLPVVSSLSLEYQDYEGYCIFFFWGKPIIKETREQVDCGDLFNSIFEAGIKDKDQIQGIMCRASEKYICSRKINDNKMDSSTVQELEDKINQFEGMQRSVSNLDSTNQFSSIRDEIEKEKYKHVLSEMILDSKRQYAVLQSLMSNKLNLYRVKALNQEKISKKEGIKMNSKKVFIIHGHNEAKRRELEKIIGDFGLIPIVLNDQPSLGMTIIEKFEHYANECGFAFALFTPDDIIQTVTGEQYFQARPNVIFELGWFYSHLGRSKTCVLCQKDDKNAIFSDLQGVVRIEFNSGIKEVYCEIREELKSAGMI